MTTHYIINGTTVHSEEYKGINYLLKKGHDLLKEHNAESIDAITDNDRFTINNPPKNGKQNINPNPGI